MELSDAVIAMAYGSPRDESEVEAYLTHIRGGRPPSGAALQELVERYRAIGFSPLDRITRAQAAALQARLSVPVIVGYKHSPPFVADAARAARAGGARRVIGLPLAPHYSRMSLGEYERALRGAWDGELVFIAGYHDHPAFIAALRSALREAMVGYRPDRVFFTAHSLPARIVAEGDPYRDQLLRTCELVAAGLDDLPSWEFAFQSQSATGEPWLGPDILDAIAACGARRVLVCPAGFVADHLEILYDLDIETRRFCADRGIEFRRTAAMNDRPEFIDCLQAVVESAVLAPAEQP